MDNFLFNKLIRIRRNLHENPELGYNEIETSNIVKNELKTLNVSFKDGVAKTGVVAEITRGRKGKCVAIRADMDALPIFEDNDLDFKSKKPGVMHACGHDLHTSILIGVVNLLDDKDFNGKIKFIFQPSEEGVNGDNENKSGGQRIVEEGILDDCDYAIALHVHPLLPVGVLGYTIGQSLACSNSFKISITGKAGHAGAAPHLSNDAILIATDLVQNLHTIVSRNVPPIQPSVVSITKINGGTAPNVICDYVEIVGTVRSLDLDNYYRIIARMEEIVKGFSLLYSCKIDFHIGQFYPSLLNDSDVHLKVKKCAQDLFGEDSLFQLEPMLGGEDFAFYSRKIPSMFYWLGAKLDNCESFFLHHPKVQFDESCMKYGAKFLSDAALELLK